jgi:6-phosphogluconolactonase
MSCTITVFAYNSNVGAMQEVQTRDLFPERFEGYRSGAEIAIHPSGKFIYATTRSHGSKGMPPSPGLDLVVWYAIDRHNGKLGEPSRISSGGGIPRSIIFDKNGNHLYVAHQSSGTIVTFRIDPDTGEPCPTGNVISTPNPVCLALF